MAPTLDYHHHSNIFAGVLRACSHDRNTLNTLRLLCAATKYDVDAFYFSAIRLHFVTEGPTSPGTSELYITSLDQDCLPEERAYAPNPALLCATRGQKLPHLTKGMAPIMEFALQQAHFVSLYLTDLHHDHLWSTRAARSGLSYHSPVQMLGNVSRMSIYHCGSPDLGNLGPAIISLPPRVDELRLTVPGGLCHSAASYEHTASTLTLHFPQHLVCVCLCATSMLRPCVQHLILEVCLAKYATAYLESIKDRNDLHPSLRVAVFAKQQLTVKEEAEFGSSWSELMGVPVTVRSSAHGRRSTLFVPKLLL